MRSFDAIGMIARAAFDAKKALARRPSYGRLLINPAKVHVFQAPLQLRTGPRSKKPHQIKV